MRQKKNPSSLKKRLKFRSFKEENERKKRKKREQEKDKGTKKSKQNNKKGGCPPTTVGTCDEFFPREQNF